jgi:hypothetical protein
MLKKLIYIFLIALLATPVVAQHDDANVESEDDGAPPRRGYRYSAYFDVCAPHIFFNPANARSFDGIAAVTGGFNFRIVKGFSLGPYARYVGYNIYNPLYGSKGNPLSTTINVGLNLQYEVSLGERFAYIPSLNVGAGWIMYQNINKPPKDVLDAPRNTLYDWGITIQQNNGFYYWAKRNKRIAIGIVVGINYFSHEFSLRDTGLDKDPELYGRSDKGPTINLNFGLGFITNIGRISGM